MSGTGISGLLLILINGIVSYKGFTNRLFFDGYKFEVDRVLINKDYVRLLTSGFLHVNWGHLIFNMLSLYFFSGPIENNFSSLQFLLIYFTSLIGGNLLTLFVHRNHGEYSSVGASGAVCGIIFASIALFPGFGIGFFGLPFTIPGWLYGIVFVLYSIYGIRSDKNNIGHEAHLGGALIGMIVALLLHRDAFLQNYITILVIAVPAIIFIYFIITRPHLLLIDNFFYKTHKQYYSVDHKYNEEKRDEQREIDRILEKISKGGMDSLTKKEKERLREYSQTIR